VSGDDRVERRPQARAQRVEQLGRWRVCRRRWHRRPARRATAAAGTRGPQPGSGHATVAGGGEVAGPAPPRPRARAATRRDAVARGASPASASRTSGSSTCRSATAPRSRQYQPSGRPTVAIAGRAATAAAPSSSPCARATQPSAIVRLDEHHRPPRRPSAGVGPPSTSYGNRRSHRATSSPLPPSSSICARDVEEIADLGVAVAHTGEPCTHQRRLRRAAQRERSRASSKCGS